MDLFVIPTIGFKLLYAFVIVRLDRRDLVCINVTAHPTAEWVARQITCAKPIFDQSWITSFILMLTDVEFRERRHFEARLSLSQLTTLPNEGVGLFRSL